MTLNDQRTALMGQIIQHKAAIVDAERAIEQATAAKKQAEDRLQNCYGAMDTLDMIAQRFDVSAKEAA